MVAALGTSMVRRVAAASSAMKWGASRITARPWAVSALMRSAPVCVTRSLTASGVPYQSTPRSTMDCASARK
ncbi:hypothetical protein G6F62_015563 [Rhizopus arrhizus]|nr:hypothetical protein G6F62_015563 [Rhizopus arrhizus]